MSKDTCERSHALSISYLNKHGFIMEGCFRSGTMTWTDGWGNKSSISISVTIGERSSIRLYYTHTSYSGQKEDLDYPVEIASTPCHYGGKRYWFVCPLIKNGIPCNRRVGVLYGAGKYYGCRHCHGLAYASQQETHTSGLRALLNVVFNDFFEKESKLRVKYWKGEPTKRYARLLRKHDNYRDKHSYTEAYQRLREKLL